MNLSLEIAVEREVNGVGMGVLTDGTPFLNIRGLARMCGVDHTMILRITEGWDNSPLKPREKRIREIVREQGFDDSVAFFGVMKNGTIHHAIPSAVCMAVLEYYALEAKSDNRDHALASYRILARKGFDDYIYDEVGYSPRSHQEMVWKQFHDRVSLTYSSTPAGYFCVFKEIADIFVTMIREGANIGPSFIPDGSVGSHWARYWAKENLAILHGERIKFDHYYPPNFPQALSNPQDVFCYPDEALGDFRKWMREVYIPEKMPVYLSDKVRQGSLPAKAATAAIEAFKAKQIAAR